MLQARLELAPDRQARMLGRARPHRARRHQLGEQRRIGGRHDPARGSGPNASSSAHNAAAASPASRPTARPPRPAVARASSSANARWARISAASSTCRTQRPASGTAGRPARAAHECDQLAGAAVAAGHWGRPRRGAAPTSTPEKPPARRGPRRQASSSSRARCRKAPAHGRRRASGCLRAASRVTGSTPSTIRRAVSSRNAPGGVWSSGVPAESSTSICQRRSSTATRRARWRSGVTRAARPSRLLERGAHAQRQRQRFARQIGMFFQTQALRRRRRSAAPCAARRRSWPPAASPRAAAARAPDRCRRARRVPVSTAARSTSSASSSCLRPYCGWPGVEHAPARLVHLAVEAGQHHGAARQALRSPAAARASPGMLPVEPAATMRCGGRLARASARRGGEQAVAALGRIKSAFLGQQSRPGLGDHRQHRRGSSASARPARPAPGWSSAASATRSVCSSSSSAASSPGKAQRVLIGQLERCEQPREQQLAAQRRRSPAASAARARSSSSSSSASISPIGWIRGNSSAWPDGGAANASRAGCGRRAGSAAGPARRRAPCGALAASASSASRQRLDERHSRGDGRHTRHAFIYHEAISSCDRELEVTWRRGKSPDSGAAQHGQTIFPAGTGGHLRDP